MLDPSSTPYLNTVADQIALWLQSKDLGKLGNYDNLDDWEASQTWLQCTSRLMATSSRSTQHVTKLKSCWTWQWVYCTQMASQSQDFNLSKPFQIWPHEGFMILHQPCDTIMSKWTKMSEKYFQISRIFPEPCCVVAWAVLKAEGVKCMCFRQCTHLFSALVRLPVHSLTSRGHSQGHSHSFCSILNSKQLNSRSVRNLYSQFDSDLMFA